MTLCVLFVCTGNICRSPLAEGVFRAEVFNAGLDKDIEIDSAGTGPWHVGEKPHPNSRMVAREKGFTIDDLRGRQIGKIDFSRFDHIIAMDRINMADLLALAPPGMEHKISLFLSFSKDAGWDAGEDAGGGVRPEEVDDPYGRDPDAYRETLSLCEDAARGLLSYIRMNEL